MASAGSQAGRRSPRAASRGALFLVIALRLAGAPPALAAAPCVADCDHSGRVSAADLLEGVAALAAGSAGPCIAADANRDGAVEAAEIRGAIAAIFGVCEARPEVFEAVSGDVYDLAYADHLLTAAQAAALAAALDGAGALTGGQILELLPLLFAQHGVAPERVGRLVLETTRQQADDCEHCLATCSGRCVQGPRGDCVCFERLPPDEVPPPGGRVIVLVLDDSEGEDAARDALRRPCADIVLHAGVDDLFSTANGLEPAAPSPHFAAWMQQTSGRPPAGFDATVEDRFFGHTFDVPAGRCVDRAALRLRARPISPSAGADNDALRLFFMVGPGQFAGASWAAFFGAGNASLPNLTSQLWIGANFPNGQTFQLDLGNLPGAVDLRADIDSRQSLDVFAQDDTSVDYLELSLRLCNCPDPPPSPTRTATRTETSVPTLTPTRTFTATFTPMPTATTTATVIVVATPSETPTAAPTSSPSATSSPTLTTTAPGTPTRTATRVPSRTFTPTPSATQDSGPTGTSTSTRTITPPRVCVTPPSGMVAWWPMDDPAGATTLEDIVGGQNAGVSASPVGAAMAPQATQGVVGGAIDFPKFGNGQSGASVGPQGALATAGAGDLTLDAWVRVPPAAAGRPHWIIRKYNSAQSRGYALSIVSPQAAGNERLEFLWGDGANGGTVQSSTVLSVNQWHHVAATFARNVGGHAVEIVLYVDGVPAGQFAGNPPGLGSLTNFILLQIGAFPSNFEDPISIDELEVFTRALAPQEIQALAEAGGAGKCRTPTPTPSETASATPVAPSPTPTPSATAPPTPSRTPTPSLTPSASATATPPPTATATPSPTRTPTWTQTPTASATPTSTRTPTATSTATATRTATPTPSATATPSPTRTPTASATPTSTPTSTRTSTSTATRTATPTPSATATASATPPVTPTCIPPPAHMVAWWSLDDPAGATTVVDVGLPSANDGVPQPGAVVVFPPGGPMTVPGNLITTPADSALFFWGPNVLVEVPHHLDLDLAGADLTVDAWVGLLPGPWPAVRDDLHVYPVIDKLDLAGTGYAFYVEVESSCPSCPPIGQQPPPIGAASTTEIRLVLATGTGASLHFERSSPIYSGSGTILPFPTPPTALSPQPPPWLHVAVTVDRAAGAGRFHADGVHLVADDFVPVAGVGNTVPAWLGASRLFGGVHAPGYTEFTLNEIEVFDAALAPAAVQAIADADAGKCKPTAGPPSPTTTPTSSPAATSTATRTPTPTRTPTVTPTATRTATSTRTATATRSATPSAPPTSTPTATRTRTLTSTATATRTPTASRTATRTSTPTSTPTATATSLCPGAVCTPTHTVTRTPTSTATATRTPTRTASRTPTPPCFAEVCVHKFHDLNQNGILDMGEPGLPGWTIEFRDLGGNLVASVTTLAAGTICTGIGAPAVYVVGEILQGGWTRSFPPPPGTHGLTVDCAQLANLSFGNFVTGSSPPTFTPTATATRTRTPTPPIVPPVD